MRTSSTIQIGEVHLYEKSFNSLSHNQNVSITWVQYIGLLCPAKKTQQIRQTQRVYPKAVLAP